MRVQDLDAKNSAANTDELIITDSSHKSWRITFANFFTSIWSAITSFASLSITTLLSVTGDLTVTGDTQLADASITGDADITGDLDVTGDVNITGGLEVTGDIIQHGSAYETHAQKVYTKDDVINLRDGAIAGLAADEYAGVIAKHYDADGNDGALVFNRSGEARVGDYTVSNVTVYSSDGTTFYTDAEMTEPATIPAGITPQLVAGTEYSYTAVDDDTEPLLTRDEAANMTDKAIAIWDAATKKVKSAPVPTAANKVPISNADGSFSWGEVSQNIQAVFDALRPIGSTYTQFPGQASPNDLWSNYSTWEVLNYAGAFFRAEGGNAQTFDSSLTDIHLSGTTIIKQGEVSNIAIGDILYDPDYNEYRTVTGLTVTANVSNIEIDSAFTNTNITNVLIRQKDTTAVNGLKANSSADGTGTDNKTATAGNWSFDIARGGYGNTIVWAKDNTSVGSGSSRNLDISNDSTTRNTHRVSSPAHSHSVYLAGDSETRPINYTIKIWKRIS